MIKYFGTRTEARKAAKEAEVKVIDLGTDAEKGQRWAIEVPDVVETNDSVQDAIFIHELAKDADVALALPCGIKRNEVLKTRRNKECTVSYRRSKTNLKLAALIN